MVQLSKVSIFGCPVGIANIRLLRWVLLDVPLVNVFIPVVHRQDNTLTLMQSKDITEVVLTRLICHLIFWVYLMGVNERRMGLLLKLEMGKWVKRCCIILLVHLDLTIISAIVLITLRHVFKTWIVVRLLLYHSVRINNSIELAKVVIHWALVKLRAQIFSNLTRESLLVLILRALSTSCFKYIDLRLYFLWLRWMLKLLIRKSPSFGGCFDDDLLTTLCLAFSNHVLVVCWKLNSEISVG